MPAGSREGDVKERRYGKAACGRLGGVRGPVRADGPPRGRHAPGGWHGRRWHGRRRRVARRGRGMARRRRRVARRRGLARWSPRRVSPPWLLWASGRHRRRLLVVAVWLCLSMVWLSV